MKFGSRLIPQWTLFFVAFAAWTSAYAGEFPLRDNTEIIFVHDPRVDFELRNIFSRNSHYTIDSMTFSQLADPKIGLPLLESFKSAQDRGVKVRSLFDVMASIIEGKGTKNQMAMGMLTDPKLPCPGEVVCVHPIEKLAGGVEITDYVHAKYVGWDFGTPYARASFSGRNNTPHALHTMDSGFFIRPIDPTLPYLGTDLAENFEEVLSIVNEMAAKNIIPIPKKSFKPLTGETMRVALTNQQKEQVIDILSIFRKPPAPNDVLRPYQFRPKSIQLRTNQLMKQLRGKSFRSKLIARHAFENDIHAHIADEIDHFDGVIDLSAYSYGPTPKVHEALVRFVNRGNTLNVFSNGKTAHATAALNGIAVYYSYEGLIDLFDRTKDSQGKINVSLLNADLAVKADMPTFIHRKQMIFNGPNKKFVLTGSDNVTWSSGNKNDEVMVMIEDDRIVSHLSEMNRAEAKVFEDHSATMIKDLFAQRPFLYRCLKNLIRKIF